MENKGKQVRVFTTICAVMLLLIGLGLSIGLPNINGIDVGSYIFYGFIVVSLSVTVWSFQTFTKKEKKRGRVPISNTRYYTVIIAITIALLIMNMIIINFGLMRDYQVTRDFYIGDKEVIAPLGIIILLAGIVLYDKYIKKGRGSKGGIRRGWTEDEKRQVRRRQDGRCNKCGDVPPRWEYHHRDGNRSNNSLNNCEGLCPNCHSVKTHG